MSINNVTLLGRLTKDVDLSYASTGTAIAMFSVAVQRNFKDKQSGEYEADFISCKAFGKTAETIANFFKKGSEIGIVGSIQSSNYEKEGRRIFRTDVVVNSFSFVGNKKDQETSNYSKPQTSQRDPFEKTGQPIDIQDDDLPF